VQGFCFKANNEGDFGATTGFDEKQNKTQQNADITSQSVKIKHQGEV